MGKSFDHGTVFAFAPRNTGMAWEPPPGSPPPLGPDPWAPAPEVRRLRFSPTEVRHLALALGALVAAFVIMELLYGLSGPTAGGVVSVLLVTAVVGPAFLLHEFAHKVVAQRRGCWAEFRAFPLGLLLMLATAALGFLFALPGAVMIAGSVGLLSRQEYGRIGAAGPLTNVVLAGLAVPLLLTPLRAFGVLMAYINVALAFLNMLPFAPLDGEKVLRASKRLYGGVVGSIVGVAAAAVLVWRATA